MYYVLSRGIYFVSMRLSFSICLLFSLPTLRTHLVYPESKNAIGKLFSRGVLWAQRDIFYVFHLLSFSVNSSYTLSLPREKKTPPANCLVKVYYGPRGIFSMSHSVCLSLSVSYSFCHVFVLTKFTQSA